MRKQSIASTRIDMCTPTDPQQVRSSSGTRPNALGTKLIRGSTLKGPHADSGIYRQWDMQTGTVGDCGPQGESSLSPETRLDFPVGDL